MNCIAVAEGPTVNGLMRLLVVVWKVVLKTVRRPADEITVAVGAERSVIAREVRLLRDVNSRSTDPQDFPSDIVQSSP